MSGRRQERTSKSSRRGTKRVRAHKASQDAENALVFQRRVLMGVTIFTLLGSILWIVAISTDYWYSVTTTDEGIYVELTNSSLIRADVGLWKVCRTERPIIDVLTNETGNPITTCRNHNMFPSRKEVSRRPGQMDHIILDFYRTETAFAIIAMILMIMGHGFSFYTFIEQRYMFKRLAGGVHFLTAATVLVVVEVLNNSAKYAAENLHARHPVGSEWHFGFSFALAWISFITFAIAGIAFLVCSRKRKGRRAMNLEGTADEANILGRV